jgi:hypothetical protein
MKDLMDAIQKIYYKKEIDSVSAKQNTTHEKTSRRPRPLN